MRFCAANCDGPRSNMRSLIARKWAWKDAPAALAWLSTAPEGYEKNLAIRVTYAQWSRMEREAAMAWMEAQTAGEPAAWLRPIYPIYARLLSGEKPLDAIRWAARSRPKGARAGGIGSRCLAHLDEPAESWMLSLRSRRSRAKAREHVKYQDIAGPDPLQQGGSRAGPGGAPPDPNPQRVLGAAGMGARMAALLFSYSVAGFTG